MFGCVHAETDNCRVVGASDPALPARRAAWGKATMRSDAFIPAHISGTDYAAAVSTQHAM
jgi:hypothetical protein